MVIGITSSMVCVYICLLIRTFDEGATIGKDNVSKTGTNCILLGIAPEILKCQSVFLKKISAV